ncbi:tyrosine-type recombinase/integrase [Gilvibacter sp.]|uniref:tyrosine-type recombinase/integrase n=1 Tax=Gilvibacter sp. TaxID=2729997 RepID=UPI003F49DFFA
MKTAQPLLKLYQTFIRDSETGKRLKKNGERIKKASIDNYKYVYRNLVEFENVTGFELRICDASRLTKREYLTEKNYWKKFYKRYTDYLYKKGCYDNYVGHNVKVIRTFFNYLKNDRDFNTGDFQRLFYVRKEEVDILVLSPEQLKYLIHDKDLEKNLTPGLRRIKDIFVFGCTTGLRFSDLFLLTNKNFEYQGDSWYLKIKSKKTKTYSYIKLPEYGAQIYLKYRPRSVKKPIFDSLSLFNFNKSLKKLGERAEFTQPVNWSREQLGRVKGLKSTHNSNVIRFCDKMSSHMMRRTAITTLLILGMPEHLVRKISGHSHGSASFNRYVHYAQAYIDKEIEKVHEKLNIL